MTYTVPWLSVGFMLLAMCMGCVIPVALYLYVRKRFSCGGLAFWVGCGAMFLFAFVLEQAVHYLVLNGSMGPVVQSNIWRYGLYGGFMAGLFEETGRFVAFRTVLRKHWDRDENALMYGAGHGGFEAFWLLNIGMLNNLIFAVLINTGNDLLITENLSGADLEAVETAFVALSTTAPWTFLVSILERGAAVVAQLALSVLVWFAASRKGKGWLFPLAIVLHMMLDAAAVIVNGMGAPLMLVELLIWILAVVYAVFARSLWRIAETTTT